MGIKICKNCGKDFKETEETEKLWVPMSSRVQAEKKWVDELVMFLPPHTAPNGDTPTSRIWGHSHQCHGAPGHPGAP